MCNSRSLDIRNCVLCCSCLSGVYATSKTASCRPAILCMCPHMLYHEMKGKSFDVGSKHSLGNTSLLYLCFGLLLCYQCAKLVELHNPGFLFSMMIRLKNLAPTMYFFDMISKVHIFSLLIATDLISRVQS